MKVDLHMHTLMSGDSDLTVEAAFQLASEAGLAAIALTNHETVDGFDEARAIARSAHVCLVPGVEISCSFHGRLAHMLAYSDGIDCAEMREFLDGEHFEAMRRSALPIIDFLRGKGVPISSRMYDDEVARHGKNSSPLARALIRNGYVRNTAEYQQQITAILPHDLFPDDWAPPLEQAVNVAQRCGALAVLAHPGVEDECVVGLNFFNLSEGNVKDLLKTGVDGLEVFSPQHTPEQARFFLDCAVKYNLFITGGSDYHGRLPRKIGEPSLELPDRDLADVIHARDLFQPPQK